MLPLTEYREKLGGFILATGNKPGRGSDDNERAFEQLKSRVRGKDLDYYKPDFEIAGGFLVPKINGRGVGTVAFV